MTTSGVAALDALTGEIGPGSIVVITGPTMTGKSTLLRQYALQAQREERDLILASEENLAWQVGWRYGLHGLRDYPGADRVQLIELGRHTTGEAVARLTHEAQVVLAELLARPRPGLIAEIRAGMAPEAVVILGGHAGRLEQTPAVLATSALGGPDVLLWTTLERAVCVYRHVGITYELCGIVTPAWTDSDYPPAFPRG